MLITAKSPLRVSFCGGGSDLPAFCDEEPGHVISAAIDRYVYVSVGQRYKGIRLSYSITENVEETKDIKNDIARCALEFVTTPYSGVEIVSIADIDSGAGLGSSGAFTTAIVMALSATYNIFVSKERLFSTSSSIEINQCGRPIGYQDQAASAFGGLRYYTFYGDTIETEDLSYCKYADVLFSRILLVDTGVRGGSEIILENQSKSVDRVLTRKMADMAGSFRDSLLYGNVEQCGEILDEYWNLKKSLSPNITNEDVDSLYSFALKNGAIGGKICGAGGRGVCIFITYAGSVRSLASRIYDKFNLRTIIPNLDRLGTRIVYSD